MRLMTKSINEAFYNMRVLVGIEEKLYGEKNSSKNEEVIELNEEGKNEINRRRKEVYRNRENIYLIKYNENIIGSITLNGEEIDAVAIDIENQGKGYGKKLVGFGVNKILNKNQESVTLWCVEGNPAKYLYEKIGFKTSRVHEFIKKKLTLEK